MLTRINKFIRNSRLVKGLGRLGQRIEKSSQRRISNADGQVAVILIVIIAIALIFYAVSLNMGKITQTKTQITIASNQAAGILASQMASYGQQIFMVSLGGKFKQCKLTITGFILFFALLVVVLIWTPVLAASMMTIIMATAIAVTAITIDMVVIQPGLDALFNKHIAINMDQASAFLESGIRTGLQSGISDSKRVRDEFDGDTDGLYGETGGVPNDEISRFGVYYLERLKSMQNTASPAIQNFIDAMRELVYEGSDGFGLYDPVGSSYGCTYDPLLGNQVPSPCNRCCVPLSVVNPDGSTSDIRDTCCNPPCDAPGTCNEWPPCGVDITCPLQTGIVTGISQFGAQYPWDFDPYYEDPTNAFVSFRERIGRDDEHAEFGKDIDNITMIEQSIGPYTNGFRIEDTTGFLNYDPLFGGTGFGIRGNDPRTGIYSFFYKIKDWAFDLDTLDPTVEIDHCYWYDSGDPLYGCLCENSAEPVSPELMGGGGSAPGSYACCEQGGVGDGASHAAVLRATGEAVMAADTALRDSCQSGANMQTLANAIIAALPGGYNGTYNILNGHDNPNRGDLIGIWANGDAYIERYDFMINGGVCTSTLGANFTQIFTGDLDFGCAGMGPLPPVPPPGSCRVAAGGCLPGSGPGSGGRLFLPIDPAHLLVNTTYHVDQPGSLLAPDQVDLPNPNYMIAGDSVCAQYVIYPYFQQNNGFWKEGADRYCSSEATSGWPYYQQCPKHGPWDSPTDGPCSEPDGTGGMVERDCACGETGVASSTPGPQPADQWPDDALDDIVYQMPDFFEFAEGLLPMSIEHLTRTFIEWYPSAAEWIEPGIYSGASQSNPTMPCYICEHENGYLWRWLVNLKEIQARFVRFLNESHASDFCDEAWCGPSAEILDSCVPNIYPDEAAHMGTFTLENTIECLYFNETGGNFIPPVGVAPPGCVPETDVAFCNRLGTNCGNVTQPDNCRVRRTVNCGVCAPGQFCGGGGAQNVCGVGACANVSESAVLAILTGYPPTNQGITDAVPAMQAAFGAQVTLLYHPLRLDKFDFGFGLVVDVIMGSGGPNPGWGWIIDAGCTCDGDCAQPGGGGTGLYPGGNDVRFQMCWEACQSVQGDGAVRYPLGTLGGWLQVNRTCGDQASTYLPRSLLPGFDANQQFVEANIPVFSPYLSCPEYCASCLAGCSAAFGRCQTACDTALVGCMGPTGCQAINATLYPAERLACESNCNCEHEWCMFGTNTCTGAADPNEGCQIYLDECEDDECICDIPGQTDPNPYLCIDWAADNQTFYDRLSLDAENQFLKGTCNTVDFPVGYFWPDVEQSALEAQNQVAKFSHRRKFLEARLNETNFIIGMFDQVITNLEDFLTGPAADLIRARINYNSEPLPYHVAYGWRGDPNKRGQRGLWHIVKVEGRLPGKCDGMCDATQTGPTEWPRIRSYKRWLGLQRCYELTSTDGTVKMRVTRYDERRPSSDLFFPNSIRLWSFRNHPDGSPLNFAGNIDAICPPLPHPENIYDGAFLVNGPDRNGVPWNSALPSDNAACWAEANRLLRRYGVMTETCAKYYYQEGDRPGFDFQFVPCRPF